MSAEHLEEYLFENVQRTVSQRERYYGILRQMVIDGSRAAEGKFFRAIDMYQCWANYAPYFFRDFMHGYMELVDGGYSHDDITPLLESTFRIKRYVVHLLLPGAYLDESISTQEKIRFLDTFAQSASLVIRGKGYTEPDSEILYTMQPLREYEKKALGKLLGALGEACEYIYLGEQPMGIPHSGLDDDVLPDEYTLYQDFDLNRGLRTFPTMGVIRTITTYPKQSAPQFFLYHDELSTHVFYYRFAQSQDWFNGPPPSVYLSKAAIFKGNKPMANSEIDKTTDEVVAIIGQVKKDRSLFDQHGLNHEYCFIQSGVIRNLYSALGKTWQFSDEAKETLRRNTIVDQLQSEWNLEYKFDVAVPLIKKSVTWAEEIAK